MDFFEVVRRRRSVRQFTADPVAEDDLELILEAARLAPSATNDQPWHFIVIRDPELKQGLRAMVEAVLDAEIESAAPTQRQRIEGMKFYSLHFAAAPVAIAVLARPWLAGSGVADASARELGVASVATAVAQLQLAATALGYASCFASGPAQYAGRELEALLGVKPPWFLLGMVSLGVAARLPRPAPRKPLAEVCTFIG